MSSVEEYYTFKNENAKWVAAGIFNKIINSADMINFLGKNTPMQHDLDGLLIIACVVGTNELIFKLLELGANKNAKSKIGSTPIMYFAKLDNLEMVKHFIKIEANVFCNNNNNRNIIDWAVVNVKKYLEDDLTVIEKSELESLKANKNLTEKSELESLKASNKDLLEKNTNLESEKGAIQMELDKETTEKKKALANLVKVRNALQRIKGGVNFAQLTTTKEVDNMDSFFDGL